MKVKDLDLVEFKSLIKEAVKEELEEILGDPDKGLELRDDLIDDLRTSLSPGKKSSLEEVSEELGLQ